MKKYIFLLIALLILIPFKVNAAQKTNIYIFYGEGCPHCAALEKYLNKEYKKDKNINIYKYEVWNNKANQNLWQEVQKVIQEEAKGVPYFIIGNEVYQGYSENKSWEETVDDAIKEAKKSCYNDEVGVVLGKLNENNKEHKCNEKKDNEKEQTNITEKEKKEPSTKLNVPLIGEVNLKDVSLPVIAIIIGLVDGFNPCAMWILIFLITMLLDYKDKKKMWILGCTFLFTSAFVYFLFMMSILNVAMFVNKIKILKIFVALFALIFGSYNLYRYKKTKETGCDVVNKKERKKIMIKIKTAVENQKFVISLIGIITLAVSVNLIELLCSLGLPVMYTEILSFNNITGIKNIIYILIYVLFFLLDDLIVFIIAMKTLKIKAISNKYNKYSHLIGGLIMILIGILMIFKPEWLMFNI